MLTTARCHIFACFSPYCETPSPYFETPCRQLATSPFDLHVNVSQLVDI
jgi:hypothetical protein